MKKSWQSSSRMTRFYGPTHHTSRALRAAAVSLALLSLLLGLALPGSGRSQPPRPQTQTPAGNSGWSSTGALNNGRYGHTATRLQDGRVLIAGGSDASVELYDPATGRWSTTAGLHSSRVYHKALLLPDGQVLVAGGSVPFGGEPYLTSAELYDPATGKWRLTAGFNAIRFLNSMTLLADGRVLADGTSHSNALPGALDSAELYDPATERWSATTAPPGSPRIGGGRVLLSDGKVLAVIDRATSLLYDPVTEAWSRLPSSGHAGEMMRLSNGKVVSVGGFGAALYDPATGAWSTPGNSDNFNPSTSGSYTVTLLADERVLVAGGYAIGGIIGEKIYDPATGMWSFTGPLAEGRDEHTATLLADGRVLIAGGMYGSVYDVLWIRGSAELYDPTTDLTPISIPAITGVSVAGKRLLIAGEGFDGNATILLNGIAQVTKSDAENPQRLIGKKAGKKLKPGDTLQVRNPNGSLSDEIIFTGS